MLLLHSEILPTLPGRWKSFYENVAEALSGALSVIKGAAECSACRAAVGKAELAVSVASVRRALVVMDAALRSVKEGRSIQLDSSTSASSNSAPSSAAAAATASNKLA